MDPKNRAKIVHVDCQAHRGKTNYYDNPPMGTEVAWCASCGYYFSP